MKPIRILILAITFSCAYELHAGPLSSSATSDTVKYFIQPSIVRQHFEGWGVSLCWWARMCGNWSDSNIDKLVTWLVSPSGLNYRIFRYNIGGGDDPENRNCTPHHMGDGKGLRAEMEGFKDFSGDSYHWDRDAGQRKIMLKIKEKRPDAIFEAFSNSCPYYMTYSGCVAGNNPASKDNLRPEYYEEFAHYLVDVCKHYKEEYGIEFRTLEPFNEPVTDYWVQNGSQEGCHFDAKSQANFLKVLSPILASSGLSTIISASDETNVAQSVSTFNTYQDRGVLSLVGQWNTHTYGGTNPDRCRISHLCYQANKPLWMSEVGSGGSGISGNLSLAKKLIDDMRYIQPIAWIDWQYMEEWNDQWCTIRGSFSDQTFDRVKNYYVRQQCTRFIRSGYDIVTSLNSNTLAAVNPARDSLVVVVLNEGDACTHDIDLSCFSDIPAKSKVSVYRTNENNNCMKITSFKIIRNHLILDLTSQSIITAVLPIKSPQASTEFNNPDMEYLIIPRYENSRALSANSSGNVTIEDMDLDDDSQKWHIIPDGNLFVIENKNGMRLTSHRASNSSSLTAQTTSASEQKFYIESVDPVYYKISSSYQKTYSMDLVQEKTSAGTKVDMWEYANSTIPTHRQWMLVALPQTQNPANGIDEISSNPTFTTSGIYNLQGHKMNEDIESLPSGIYIYRGKKIFIKH